MNSRYLEKNGLLNTCQSGFRKSRNTIDQLYRLSDDIIKNIGNKSFVLGVFIDFEKAYDMIWRGGVLFKLGNLGFDGNIYNWMSAFLSGRSLQVRVGGSLSRSFNIDNGLPQGSVISPILFLVSINDLNPSRVKYSLFADDVALWKAGRNIKHVNHIMQQALDDLQIWCNQWGFKVSIEKTTFVVFDRGKFKQVNLTFDNQRIKKAASVNLE